VRDILTEPLISSVRSHFNVHYNASRRVIFVYENIPL
jgi:hypothetical protein